MSTLGDVKKIDRDTIKKMLLINKMTELAGLHIRMAATENFGEKFLLLMKVKEIIRQYNAIRRTPAVIFVKDGQIDKRRHKRYVRKHKPFMRLKTQRVGDAPTLRRWVYK